MSSDPTNSFRPSLDFSGNANFKIEDNPRIRSVEAVDTPEGLATRHLFLLIFISSHFYAFEVLPI